MGRVKALLLVAFIASAAAAPMPQDCPYSYSPPFLPPGSSEPTPYNPCQQYSSSKPCAQPSPTVVLTPRGYEGVKVQTQKDPMHYRLKQAGFQDFPVTGGTFYISRTPDVLVQPPPILVRPARQLPIKPPSITVQPPPLPPVKPAAILVKPQPLAPIIPPPVLARPKPLAPIKPPSITVKPPRPPLIQPKPICVTQPAPKSYIPEQVTLNQPGMPCIQPPSFYLSASAPQGSGAADQSYSYSNTCS